MAECYLDLGPGDRRDVLEFAAGASGRPACLLEKDIWVVWALRTCSARPWVRRSSMRACSMTACSLMMPSHSRP